MRKSVLLSLVFFLLCTTAWADSLTLSNPAISGIAGSTIGWGFAIGNTSGDSIVINGVTFPPDDNPNQSNRSLGSFTDYTGLRSSNLDVIAPGADTLQAFNLDPKSLPGIGSFTIAPGPADGLTELGEIVLTHGLRSAAPSTDPNATPIDLAGSRTGNFSAAASVSAVPEPGSLALMGSGFLIGAWWLRKSNRG